MKGYVSFVLVLFSVLIVLFLVDTHQKTYGFELSKQIGIERVYQNHMNVKETVFEAGIYGAEEGLTSYLLENHEFDIVEAREAMKETAHKRISMLENPNAKIWCGYVSSGKLRETIEKMKKTKKAEICEGCYEISNSECIDFIQIDMNPEDLTWELRFQGENPMLGTDGVIGVSVFENDVGIVGHIPYNERVKS